VVLYLARRSMDMAHRIELGERASTATSHLISVSGLTLAFDKSSSTSLFLMSRARRSATALAPSYFSSMAPTGVGLAGHMSTSFNWNGFSAVQQPSVIMPSLPSVQHFPCITHRMVSCASVDFGTFNR
jgi:hypothetical protein